ncbi:phage tail protein [Pseudomonas syringae pv. atrofaciens]|uniref:phage tail protein n=1 Tax=Pseudomonas syringae TaxID=317 RepID=UPI00351E6EAC
MGAALKIDIHGEKGGSSSPKSPTEASDSLRSTNLAKLLIAVGEGEFEGTPTAADIYLDNTPINDASGNVNFQNVKWEWRTGSVDQSYIPGIPSIDNETTVNVELRNDSPWVRSITNTQLSAVRVRLAWPALQQQDDEGNVGGYRIEYAIDVATDGGSYKEALLEAVDGKTTTRYERSRRIDLPAATSGWQIRVRRLTANQNTNKIADTMLVAGLTEVIDAKLRYPNTALLYIEFDAEQFTNIPAVTVKCKARKWQVPSNYDPFNRTYSGVWDGSMKEAWTNNPAWVTYGVCTQDRFGLGKRIKPWMVDKWELYRIAQYCDQDVPNGVGGVEPRFLCDMNLQGKAEAWSLLRDISGIYRGMTYWAQGQLVAQADMPRSQDFDYVFTRANVIDGKFTYGSASAKTRYTRAIVGYDNPDNNYDTDVITFADPVLQRRFGDKPTELTAIGCTRASEGQRRGKWVVMSNNQDRTVSFSTGMEGAIPLPGYIIPVADSLLAGREIGGRIAGAAGKVVTLDRDTLAKPGDRLIVNLPSGQAEGRTVQSVAGREITVTVAYSETPTTQLQWALDADDLAIPLYRVLSVKRSAEGEYAITALQYEPSKFAYIDTGARLEERPISIIPITVVAAPASVSITSTTAISQGIAVTTMTINWPAVSGAVAYDVEWRKDSGNWIKVQRTGTTSVEINGVYSGSYLARVRAVSAYDISSIWRNSILTPLNGKEGLPPAVTSLTAESLLFGIGLKWGFPSGAEDSQRTELWYAQANDLKAATKLADLAYPQADYVMQGLRAGQAFFFWARLVDRTGNIGPWYPLVNGVVGTASADATAVLEQIVGKLTESAFGKDLLSRIEKIDGNGPASVNARLAELRTALNEQIADVDGTLADVRAELQQQIDNIADLADSMPYKPDGTYKAGQGVLGSDGIIYQATQNVPVNTPPPNTTYWLNVGQAVATAVGLASRVQTVETKVTSIEGVNTAQAQQLTGLQTSLDGKASASSVQSIGNRVTDAEGKLTSQGSAITGLTSALPGKANVSTVDALTNTVNQQGGAITSQGLSLTNIAASIAMVGGQNLVYNPSFEKRGTIGAGLIAEGWEIGGPATGIGTSYVQSGIDPKGVAQRVDFTGLTASTYMDVVPAPAKRPSAAPGQPFTFFVNFRATAGLIVRIFLQPLNSSSAVLQTVNSVSMVATGSWQLHSLTIASLPADTTNVHMITRVSSVNSQTSGFLEVDRAQAQITTKVEGWRDNADTLKAEVAGQAEATSALTARVTQNETSITSASNQLVSLSNSVGTSGGQNLFFNPAFTKESAVAGAAEGWQMDAGTGGAGTATLVTSWLVSSEKAQRLDVTGLNLSANYRGIRISPANYRPKVTAGNSVVASCYVRATAGLVFKIFIQGVNAAGTDAVTVSGPLIVATGGTQRIVYDYPNLPAGTASVQVYFRLYGSDTVGAGFVEYTRAQLEVGTTVTGWRDNNGLLGAEQAATSSAVAGLNSSVTQQGSAITAVSGRVTALKASLAGEGSNFAASPASWEFLNNLNGFTASVQAGSPTLVANPTFARMTGAGQFFKNSGIDANGTTYPYLRMRFKRANSTRTAGLLYWANQDGGLSEARVIGFKVDITTTDWQTVEIDLSGNTGWVGKTNTAIRLDIVNSGDTSATVDMAYISIGNKMPGASAAALSSTTATVTQQGATIGQQGAAISAQATRIDGLGVSVGNASSSVQREETARVNADAAIGRSIDSLSASMGTAYSAIQSESVTRADADGALSRRVDDVQATAGNANAYAQQAINAAASANGKISSSYAVKLGTTANGIQWAAGFGLGLSNETGVTQSQFVVSADSFVVLNGNPNNGAVFSPFAVENGQVFIADAVIKKASITNALVGQSIYSSTFNNFGQPLMTADFNTGQLTIQNRTKNGSYCILREDGLFAVSGGVVLMELTW